MKLLITREIDAASKVMEDSGVGLRRSRLHLRATRLVGQRLVLHFLRFSPFRLIASFTTDDPPGTKEVSGTFLGEPHQLRNAIETQNLTDLLFSFFILFFLSKEDFTKGRVIFPAKRGTFGGHATWNRSLNQGGEQTGCSRCSTVKLRAG